MRQSSTTGAKEVVVTMTPDQWRSYSLHEKKRLSSDMYLYRFSLPFTTSSLGWNKVERHLRVRALSTKNANQYVVRE